MTSSQIKELIISLLPSFHLPFYEQEKIETPSYQELLDLFPEYSYRENQKKLYEICQNTFTIQQKALIEAPT
jgi:Golgi nucleoside diphosphatase